MSACHRIAYFDCYAGASGDMILGALLAAGLPLTELQAGLDRLRLPIQVQATRVHKGAILATQVHIVTEDDAHSRTLAEIEALVQAADLPEPVLEQALRIFRRLGEAEAAVHGEAVDSIHLHEVGGLDAIADIVGAVLGLYALGVEYVSLSPLPLGRGMAQSRHGAIPLPAPAVTALIAGWPVRGIDVETELVTPTGAAILTTLAASAGPMPAMVVESGGYGAGQRDMPFPNVLRLWLGRADGNSGQGDVGQSLTSHHSHTAICSL